MTIPATTVFPPADVPAEPERRVPYPPRFWWLKRLALVCVVLSAGLVALRLWWGNEADHRLRRALDPLVAAGSPVVWVDLAPPGVPDEENAAAYFKRAIAAIDMMNDSPAASSSDAPFYSAEWGGLSEKSVAGSAKVFPLARRARDFDRFDWGTQFKRPAISILLPHLNGARHLANTVGDAALYAHYNGDDAAALESIRDVRHLAKAAGREPFFVCHLVGVGIEALAQQRLQMIAAGLHVAPEESSDDASQVRPGTPPFPTTKAKTVRRPASRAQVRGLVAELLDERDIEASLKGSFAGERALQFDMADWMKGPSKALRPMYDLDALRMLEHGEVLMAAAEQPTWPAAKARVASAPLYQLVPAPPGIAVRFVAGRRQPVDHSRVLSSGLIGGMATGRVIEQNLRVRTDRRMTAISLAAQLYRSDHGQWPPSLEALVPNYLPAVPGDAMAADGGPLKYLLVKGGLPGGGDRPVVYSVGGNGVDDTPDATVLPGAPWSGWHNGRDEYRDVAHWTPPTPTGATQPATRTATRPASQPPPATRGATPAYR